MPAKSLRLSGFVVSGFDTVLTLNHRCGWQHAAGHSINVLRLMNLLGTHLKDCTEADQ